MEFVLLMATECTVSRIPATATLMTLRSLCLPPISICLKYEERLEGAKGFTWELGGNAYIGTHDILSRPTSSSGPLPAGLGIAVFRWQ
jgi:hypothetical protein